MIKKSYLLWGLVLLAMFVFSGCAPTILGDNTRMGSIDAKKPLFGDPSERLEYLASLKYEVISEGESLTIKIHTENSVCTANLKLDSMRKGSSMVPFMDPEPTLLYKGTWEENLSSECLKAVEKKGGLPLYAQVWEPSRGNRTVLLCTDQSYTLYGVPCNLSVIGFQIPEN